MAYSIAVLSSKGGVGKSTITCGICAVLSLFAARHKILAIDAGGQAQHNTLLYLEGCGDLLPNVDVGAADDFDTLSNLGAIDAGHTFKLFDLPGYSRAEELDAVLVGSQDNGDVGRPVADLLIVPMLVSEFDVESVVPFVLDVIVPTGIPYGVVLSRVRPRALTEAIDVQRQLQADGIDVFATLIREYRGVRDAQRDRKPITRYGGRHDTARSAEDDLRALTREALKRVGSRIHIPTRADQAEETRRGKAV
jgi:chromosome partitioning protein